MSVNTNEGNLNSKTSDKERDRAAKGGPATGIGIADGKHSISQPYNEDIQTQIAAKSSKQKKDKK